MLSVPCAYQGGKQRLAPAIVDVITEGTSSETTFYDLCCGSGAVAVELVNRGIPPSRITMVDAGPWGLVWERIGNGSFDLTRFADVIDAIPTDPRLIEKHVKSLSEASVDDDSPYVFLVLQAAAFGSKAVWVSDGKWRHSGFRSYWEPTLSSSRRSPVNPMMPMPDTLFHRVEALAVGMRGVCGVNADVNSLVGITDDSVVYIDPPYSGTTRYGHELDAVAFASGVRRAYVSEARPLTDNAVRLSSGEAKGGISGERRSPHEEWLSAFHHA